MRKNVKKDIKQKATEIRQILEGTKNQNEKIGTLPRKKKSQTSLKKSDSAQNKSGVERRKNPEDLGKKNLQNEAEKIEHNPRLHDENVKKAQAPAEKKTADTCASDEPEKKPGTPTREKKAQLHALLMNLRKNLAYPRGKSSDPEAAARPTEPEASGAKEPDEIDKENPEGEAEKISKANEFKKPGIRPDRQGVSAERSARGEDQKIGEKNQKNGEKMGKIWGQGSAVFSSPELANSEKSPPFAEDADREKQPNDAEEDSYPPQARAPEGAFCPVGAKKGPLSRDLLLLAGDVAGPRSRKKIGVPSGFFALDELTGGFPFSALTVIAGRPSMGKTSLVLRSAFLVAGSLYDEGEGKSAAFFSLETSRPQLVQKLVATETSTELMRLLSGDLSETARKKIQNFAVSRGHVPLYIEQLDGESATLQSVCERATKLWEKNNTRILFVDYLQVIDVASDRSGGRVREVDYVVRGLRDLAQRLGIPVVVTSQLGRSVDLRVSNWPRLSDLKDCSSIEECADVVMLLYRGDYYLSRGRPEGEYTGDGQPKKGRPRRAASARKPTGLADVCVAKNRFGPTGTVKLFFDAATTRFSNLGGPKKPE